MARVSRLVIGIYGRINAGKSTLMNLLTQQETSIVDRAPGTTADIKSAIMEIHSLGPVRILDTAGLDEGSSLGEKKRKKTLAALEETDIVLIVIDPVQVLESGTIEVEDQIGDLCRKLQKQICVVFNLRPDYCKRLEEKNTTLEEMIEHCKRILPDPFGTPSLNANIKDSDYFRKVIDFIAINLPEKKQKIELLPFVGSHGSVLLHIPLDEESPGGRLLRPQEMAMEYLLRLTVPVGLYRTNLQLARSGSDVIREKEQGRFSRFLDSIHDAERIQLVITDSQAIDIMDSWVSEDIPLTTFSIMMINQISGGNLLHLVNGTEILNKLKRGDKILIAEACNHDRMAEDIGTVQIPQALLGRTPGIVIEHAFGREFPESEELMKYRLVIHCGGCMISSQKYEARIRRLTDAGVPLTNYGLVLAWLQGPATLKRVIEPWQLLKRESKYNE